MNKNFGRNRKYEQHLEGRLPEELEKFRHSIEWPINVNLDEFHLAHYYKEDEHDSMGGFHHGIDMQVPAQTRIYAPENGIIISVWQDEFRDPCLADIMMYSSNSGIVYDFAHVQYFELPDKIRKCRQFDRNSGIRVKKGEEIAKVGYWPFLVEKYPYIHEDIKAKGGYYCHLHFETGFCPDITRLEQPMKNTFNPLLILQKL